jgi:DNA-binding beta-propeller fold protein YncE
MGVPPGIRGMSHIAASEIQDVGMLCASTSAAGGYAVIIFDTTTERVIKVAHAPGPFDSIAFDSWGNQAYFSSLGHIRSMASDGFLSGPTWIPFGVQVVDGLACSRDANRNLIYAADAQSTKIAVIEKDKFIDFVKGIQPAAHGIRYSRIAFATRGSRAFALSTLNTIAVIDTINHEKLAEFAPLSGVCTAIATAPEADMVYLAITNMNGTTNTVEIRDTNNYSVLRTIYIGGLNPYSIVVDELGAGMSYVSDPARQTVTVISNA